MSKTPEQQFEYLAQKLRIPPHEDEVSHLATALKEAGEVGWDLVHLERMAWTPVTWFAFFRKPITE